AETGTTTLADTATTPVEIGTMTPADTATSPAASTTAPLETSPPPTSTAMPTSATTTTPATTPWTTTPKPSTSTARPALTCENGGTYDGEKCICTSAFNGPLCQFANDVIATNVSTFKTEVDVQVRVTNKIFTEELNNKSSLVYIDFELQFRLQMKTVYQSVAGYQGVIILNLRQGSIVVDHTVIIEAPLSNNLEATLASVTEQVVKQLEVVNTTGGNCSGQLCFTAPSNPVLKNATTNFSAADTCKESAPPGFAEYYSPHITEKGVLSCLTRCSQDVPDFLNCHYGQCQLKISGPQCACANMDVFWYPGDRCQTRVSKVGVGMAVPLVILFIGGIVLATFLIRARSRGSKARYRGQ
ncbi:mucin 3A, cell surface associated, partial [Chelydra serpentina]